jgi:hypothetical protein
MTLIASYLARKRGKQDDYSHLLDTLAPPSLSSDGKHQLDVRVNVSAAIDIRLLSRDGDRLSLDETAAAAAKNGPPAIARHVRTLVLAESVNTAQWGSQSGARDLTNALSWFLTFTAATAPTRMEGAKPSAKDSQEADFGPRQSISHGSEEEEVTGWPISNETRWNTFQRWACSLGFAWRTPQGRLVPDPTPAIRDVLPMVFGQAGELQARSFIEDLGTALPVLETGRYREFVVANWRRPQVEPNRLTSATTDSLERLVSEGYLALDDRDDSPRVVRSDGSTFSHVRRGGSR